jgi:hypothetical protein
MFTVIAFFLFKLHSSDTYVVHTKCYLERQPPIDEFTLSNYYFGSVHNQPEINGMLYLTPEYDTPQISTQNKLWIPCTYYVKYGALKPELSLTVEYYMSFIPQILIIIIISIFEIYCLTYMC